MEALIATYGDDSDSDSDISVQTTTSFNSPATKTHPEPVVLPPPPISLLTPPNSIDYFPQTDHPNRVRTFPHIEGNYALHVYIPVYIPVCSRKELGFFLKRVSSAVPGCLYAVDADVPIDGLCKDDVKFEQVGLSREFHVSLGRTVPIRVHQIDSVVSMLRQKLQSQKRYWIDFSKWEVFVNDDCTRTFISLEVVTGGLAEITKQIQSTNEVYKLHSLPEFYKDPRPHISLAWAQGDCSDLLKRVVREEMMRSGNSIRKCIFTTKFGGIDCKIGNKTYPICKIRDDY